MSTKSTLYNHPATIELAKKKRKGKKKPADSGKIELDPRGIPVRAMQSTSTFPNLNASLLMEVQGCLPPCVSQSCSCQVEGLRDRRPVEDGAESDSGSDDAVEGGAEGNLDFALFKRTKVRE